MPDSSFGPAANLVLFALTAVVLFFALDLWRRIVQAVDPQHVRGTAARAAIVLAVWLALALVATWVPAVGAVVVSIPGLLAGLLVSITALLAWTALRPAFSRALDATSPESVMSFFYWRAIVGALLLAPYAAGRLPAGFAVPAGLGDIAVTLLAVAVLALKDRHGEPPRAAWAVWNLAGLLDLIVSVLFLGLTVLRPWAAQRGLSANFTLQLFLVPIFIAAHIYIFGRLWRRHHTPPLS